MVGMALERAPLGGNARRAPAAARPAGCVKPPTPTTLPCRTAASEQERAQARDGKQQERSKGSAARLPRPVPVRALARGPDSQGRGAHLRRAGANAVSRRQVVCTGSGCVPRHSKQKPGEAPQVTFSLHKCSPRALETLGLHMATIRGSKSEDSNGGGLQSVMGEWGGCIYMAISIFFCSSFFHSETEPRFRDRASSHHSGSA